MFCMSEIKATIIIILVPIYPGHYDVLVLRLIVSVVRLIINKNVKKIAAKCRGTHGS